MKEIGFTNHYESNWYFCRPIKFPQTKQKIEYIRLIRAQNGDSFYVALLVGLMESFINTKSKVKIYRRTDFA